MIVESISVKKTFVLMVSGFRGITLMSFYSHEKMCYENQYIIAIGRASQIVNFCSIDRTTSKTVFFYFCSLKLINRECLERKCFSPLNRTDVHIISLRTLSTIHRTIYCMESCRSCPTKN